VGIKRQRKNLREKRELDAYWKENAQKELKFIADED
jgi:hypothetical protein